MLRSLSLKLVALVILFAGIPVLLYSQFREADEAKRRIIADGLRMQGQLIAEALRPDLALFASGSLEVLNERLRQIDQDSVRIKLLFRPEAMTGVAGFFYVASSSSKSMEYLALERDELFATPVLSGLGDSCGGNRVVSARFQNPEGAEEMLTAIVPLLHADGCWLVLTSTVVGEGAAEARLLGRAYWAQPEVVLAALVLLLSAGFVLLLFLDIWLGLRRFARLAREHSANTAETASFAERNRVPELASVARDFDRLVASLRRSSQAVRELAEENAHAVKGPLAVIAQSIEPLRRSAERLDPRGKRAVELIERSVERLDEVVSQARDIETAEAELMTAPRARIEVMEMLEMLSAGFRQPADGNGVAIAVSGPKRAFVLANREQLEIAIENAVENAIGFSPPGGRVDVEVAERRGRVEIAVVDDGPGVDEGDLERIFERSVSLRPAMAASAGGAAVERENFGIGLWIARRNVSYAGGSIRARNRPGRGLAVELALPSAGA